MSGLDTDWCWAVHHWSLTIEIYKYIASKELLLQVAKAWADLNHLVCQKSCVYVGFQPDTMTAIDCFGCQPNVRWQKQKGTQRIFLYIAWIACHDIVILSGWQERWQSCGGLQLPSCKINEDLLTTPWPSSTDVASLHSLQCSNGCKNVPYQALG